MMLGCWGLRQVRGGDKFLNLRYLSAKNFTPRGLVFRSCPHPQFPNFNCSILVPAQEVKSLKWPHTILKMFILQQNVQNLFTFTEMTSRFTCTWDWWYNFLIFKVTVNIKFAQLCLIFRKKKQGKNVNPKMKLLQKSIQSLL